METKKKGRPKLAPEQRVNYQRYLSIVDWVLSENNQGRFPTKWDIIDTFTFEGVEEYNFPLIKGFGRKHGAGCWLYYSRIAKGYAVGDEWKDTLSGGVKAWTDFRVTAVKPQLRNMVTALDVAAPFNGRTSEGAIAKMVHAKLASLLQEIDIVEECFGQLVTK